MTKPKFAVNQIWFDDNDTIQIISSISTDASVYFPIHTLSGDSFTIEGKFIEGVVDSKYSLKKFIGKYARAN